MLETRRQKLSPIYKDGFSVLGAGGNCDGVDHGACEMNLTDTQFQFSACLDYKYRATISFFSTKIENLQINKRYFSSNCRENDPLQIHFLSLQLQPIDSIFSCCRKQINISIDHFEILRIRKKVKKSGHFRGFCNHFSFFFVCNKLSNSIKYVANYIISLKHALRNLAV